MASSEDEVVVRLRLKDLRQFIDGVKSGELAIEELEKKVRKAGSTAAAASSSSGGLGRLGSMLGGLKWYALGAVGSLAAAGAGVGAFAVKSAASLEQVTVAFTTLLHSSSAATKMVASLQTFAINTPFELAGVEASTQKLLAFGFSAKTIIPTLTAVGNAASGLNLGQGGMDEIITALGQMRMKGRVQGDELLQLAEHGVNAYAYLQQSLKLTPEQLQKAVQAGKVSAATAIPIILKGMDAQFKGLMDKESHTLGGMWSNFHDAMQQGLVKLANPLMPTMKRWLGEATEFLGGTRGHSSQGLFGRASRFMSVLPGNLAAGRNDYAAYNIGAIFGNHGADGAIEKALNTVDNLGRIFRDVLVPALKDFSVLLVPVVALLDHLDSATGFIADHADVFAGLAESVGAGWLAFQAYSGVAGILGPIIKSWQVYKAATEEATVAQWLLNIAMDANPIGLIIVGIAAVATGIWYAYNHSETFRKAVGTLWDGLKSIGGWISRHWQGIIAFLTDPFTALLDTIHGLEDAWGWLTSTAGGSSSTGDTHSVRGGHYDPSAWAPAKQANGGTTISPGMSWVGERGPELLSLPRGAQVIPLPRVPDAVARGPIHVHVMLDQREIASAVYDDMESRIARR